MQFVLKCRPFGRIVLELIKQILWQRLFLAGVLTRLSLIFLVEPSAAINFYIPFLDFGVSSFSLNPWLEWTSSGGSELAFPYGMAMYLVFIPAFLVGDFLSVPPYFSYFLTIFLMEFLLLIGLANVMKGHISLITALFWFSPVNLVALYFYGFNDIIPATFLFCSVWFLYSQKWLGSGIFLAFAVSAKLSMIIAFPVIFLYFLKNSNLQVYVKQFAFGFLTFMPILSGVYLFSPEALSMLLGNPEVRKVSTFYIEIFGRNLMVVPLVYFLFLYQMWRLGRLDLENINALIALSFLFFAVLFSDTPGWLLWSIPFLVIYQCQQRDLSLVLVLAFSSIFIIQVLFQNPVVTSMGLIFEFGGWLDQIGLDFQMFDSLLVSLVLSLAGIIGIRIWRQSVVETNFHKATRQPFVVAIAGDSGSGKDTIAEAIIAVTGVRSSVNISGDDYHKYDRSKGEWKAVTHLNPVANNLNKFAADIMRLKLGKPIRKRHYDHSTGKLSRLETVSAKDFVIASGLHSFSNAKLENLADVTIYLNMDDNLRRHFKLQRDVKVRKKGLRDTLDAIEKRIADFQKYVMPQMQKANIIFRLNTTQPLSLDADVKPQKLFLDIDISGGLEEATVLRLLAGLCQCQVTPILQQNHNFKSFRVSGDVSASSIELAAKSLGFNENQLFDLFPDWKGGMIGVMQLISVALIKLSMTPTENI
jgi:uridine kinase